MSDEHTDISAYANSVGVDHDTALAHLLLFEVVDATGLDDEKRKEAFDMLCDLIDPKKLAASVKAMATTVAAPCPPASSESPADTAAEDQGDLWSPEQAVPSSRVMAAVPDDATALEAGEQVMSIWEVQMERDVTRVGRVTVEAESEQAARLAAFEFLENGEGDDYDHWEDRYGECEMFTDPAEEQEQPEIRATDAEGNYEMVDEDE